MDDPGTHRYIGADWVVAAVGAFLMILGPSMNDNGSLLIAGSILLVGSLIAHAIRTNPPILIRLPSKEFLDNLGSRLRNLRLRYSLRTLLIAMTVVALLLGEIVISTQ